MRKIYVALMAVLMMGAVLPRYSVAQSVCDSFHAVYKAYESRCTATGSIKVAATGGSGNYKYKVTGPVNTNFTSTDSITGLAAGPYTLTVNDINTNCTITITEVIVPGTYQDPRFTLNTLDVTCDNGSNGKITLNKLVNGRGPFMFSIVAPSPMGVGTTSASGIFTSLIAGVYTIRLVDSCGGIQTRLVTINNYTWRIDAVVFAKTSCDSAGGFIKVIDSKGNVSTVGGIPGLLYGVVRSPGDTLWSAVPTFSFNLAGHNSFEIVVKDACGKIKKAPVAVSFKPSVNNSVNTYAYTCDHFTAAVTGVRNFFNPVFCLTDTVGTLISCNATGVFTHLAYGSYCIQAHDSCSDTIIVRCFTAVPPRIQVGTNVNVYNKICASFSAAVTGQVGLTAPQYCLFDSSGSMIECNNTGVFNGLAYGNYCISIKDSCRDTTITRCFAARKPVPVIPAVITPGYTNCNNFGVVVAGDSVTSPRYCIFDSSGVLINCNTTGVFDSLLYGNYCISMYDSCYDTTITRCIAVYGPSVINNLSASVSSKACATFTETITGSNLTNPEYCLYTIADVLVECNSTGVFNNLAYGSYYVKAHSSCPDTIFILPFAESAVAPFLDANVTISNKTCATFSVNTTGEQHFSYPRYCLFDSADVQLSCNNNGVFTNLVYGSYCIKIKDSCYDTTITRCFSVEPSPVNLNVSTRKSCNYGFAKLSITVSGAVLPVNISVYKPNGELLFTGNYNSSNVTIDSVPGNISGEKYSIVVTDNCGRVDSSTISAVASRMTHIPTVKPMCPSSTWTNGSGSIIINAASNTGSLSVRIIKKGNTLLTPSITPSMVAGSVYTFNNLGPARYIIRYKASDGCSRFVYDTVTIQSYQYPDLARTSAYQCDQNGFSLGAVVSNGVGPFTYEIIGSTPASPSINTAPQTNPVFNIDNGSTYSLVRLRALDACGNASLQDASILPLANNGIIASFNCFQINSTLSVDTLYNSTYAWYLKHSVDGADSSYLGSGFSVNLPNVSPADTGIYVCHLEVNSGCIKRTYYYHLDGSCSHYLPLLLKSFTGKYMGDKVLLNWKMAANANVKKFVIERKSNDKAFEQAGVMEGASNQSVETSYQLIDDMAAPDNNYYRIKLVNLDNSITYSNLVSLSKLQNSAQIRVYPNPARDVITISFKEQTSHLYKVQLLNYMNQVVADIKSTGSAGANLLFTRTKNIANGIYFIKVFDINTNEVFSQKVLFR